MEKQVKFCVFSDLHVQYAPCAEEYLKEILEACRKEDVDFVIQLGDFNMATRGTSCCDWFPQGPGLCADDEVFERTVNMYADFEKPTYHVLGNHDTDLVSKTELLKMWRSENGPYYSFDVNGFHFVALDPNYVKKDEDYVSSEHGKYYSGSSYEAYTFPALSPEQLAWLKEDLANTPYPTVLFSHERLCQDVHGIANYAELAEIIENAPNKVVMSMNGHEHYDSVKQVNGIWYYNINSASMFWLDAMFECLNRYTPEIDEIYPQLRYTVPYSGAVYAIVTMDENGATVKGSKAEFVGITPEEQGVYKEDSWFYSEYQRGERIKPYIEDRYLPFK